MVAAERAARIWRKPLLLPAKQTFKCVWVSAQTGIISQCRPNIVALRTVSAPNNGADNGQCENPEADISKLVTGTVRQVH